MHQKHKSSVVCWTLLVLSSLSCGVLHALHCPSHCQCDDTTIDCSSSHLTSVPHMHLQSSALVVNFSSNSITSLDDLHNFPVSQTSLDLSFNQISSIPLNAFSGEQFVELHTLNLTNNLLSDLHFVFPSSLQVLKLSRNEIQKFCMENLRGLSQLRALHLEMNGLKTLSCEEELTDKGSMVGACPFRPLQRITEVWLRGNKLKTIDQATLHCFQNTQFISLADNAIKSIPAKLFLKFQKLKYLDLSGNQLTFIPEGMFLQLPSLKFLSLSRNRLSQVPAGLPMLEWLDLSYNAITSVPETQKNDLYPQEVFLIGGNPLHCVCNLLWLKELFDTREYLLKYIEVERSKFIPVCASPGDIRGDGWDFLGDHAFGCKDEETNQPISSDNQEKPAIVRLEELAVKVRDVGTTHIRLEWDSFRLNREKPVENRESRRVFISCHPFGRKQEKKSAIVQLTLGSHRLRGLQPSTAYVICVSLADSSSGDAQPRSVSRNDCMEVVTKEDEQSKLRDIYMRISVVVIVSVLLTIKCCYTNNLRKDISSRHKDD